MSSYRRARGTGAGRGAGKGRRQPQPAAAGFAAARPDPGDRLPKFSLAPYATATGSPFYLPQQVDEKTLLSLKRIAETRSPRNSEAACLRLGIALSEAAGVAEMGAEALQYHADKQLGNLGLDELVEFMASEAGQEYVAAAKALNKTNNALENEEDVKAAVDGWVGSLNALLAHQKSIRKLAQVSARLYLWSMDTLEQLALLKYPAAVLEHVAVDNPALELKAVKALVENPRVSALRAALVASYTKAIFGQGQKKARKCNLAASSPEAAASSSTGTEKSGSATSSEESKSKKKKSKKDKKGKKHTKKATKDKKSKHKKGKDKKKRTKSSSCSNSKASSSAVSQKEKQKKKDKKDGPAPLKVRRVTAVADGKAVVREDALYDEIDRDAKVSVDDALKALFKKQSSVEELANWAVHTLNEDLTMSPADVSLSTFASPDLALLRKGG